MFIKVGKNRLENLFYNVCREEIGEDDIVSLVGSEEDTHQGSDFRVLGIRVDVTLNQKDLNLHRAIGYVIRIYGSDVACWVGTDNGSHLLKEEVLVIEFPDYPTKKDIMDFVNNREIIMDEYWQIVDAHDLIVEASKKIKRA